MYDLVYKLLNNKMTYSSIVIFIMMYLHMNFYVRKRVLKIFIRKQMKFNDFPSVYVILTLEKF